MTHLLAELDIDAACDEFLRARGAGNPQPIVLLLDQGPDDDEETPDPDWDELTAHARKMCAPATAETTREFTERVLGRMGL